MDLRNLLLDTSLEPCYHGGAFFESIGNEFENLDLIDDVINADVLDAWFPPSPKVISLLRDYLPWVIRTSPPTNCEGLISAISRARKLPPESVLPGGGSSSLIFLALRHWLGPSSRALVLDPTYGEYLHVMENVIGCRVDRFKLDPDDGYEVDLARLDEALRKPYDLVVLVNPNNPTGRHIPRQELEALARRAPPETLFWIDEAYIDYVGQDETLEAFSSASKNVIVCKSMSKVYSLSGLRVGYLCGPPRIISQLRPLNPPWAVGLPGQVAGVAALQDEDYYLGRYHETHNIRRQLHSYLESKCQCKVVPGSANFLFLQLPESAPPTETVMERCRKQHLFLRDPAATTPRLGERSLRVAVKDSTTNIRMVGILNEVLK